MCDVGTALSLGATLLGGVMQQQAASDAADAQREAIARAQDQQDQYARQAERTAMDNAKQYDPTQRAQRFDQARESAGDSLAQQLTAARESAPGLDQAQGRISKVFADASAKSGNQTTSEAMRDARLMGRMRGAQDMLTEEGYRNADYASQLGVIGRNAQGAYRAAQPGITAAGVPDSTQTLLGGLISGAGSALSNPQAMGRISSMFGGSGFSRGSPTRPF